MMHYVHRNPNPKTYYKCSDMILLAQSDGFYLCTPQAKSLGAAYICLGNKLDSSFINGDMQVLCQLFKVVVSSVAETELEVLFITGKMRSSSKILNTNMSSSATHAFNNRK